MTRAGDAASVRRPGPEARLGAAVPGHTFSLGRPAVTVTEAMVQRAYATTATQGGPVETDCYRRGDVVVYAAHGVGRIDGVGIEKIGGHLLEIIQLSFLENRMTVRVPAAKARSVGLRKLSTPDAIARAVIVLGGTPRVSKLIWARRAQEYQGKINSGALIALAEVLRDLRRNALGEAGSYTERNVFEAALDRMASEIAAVEETDKASAVAKITGALHAALSS